MRNALGKGLAQLLGDSGGGDGPRELSVRVIVPNPKQPRKNFDAAALGELAESMQAVGIVQPLIVRPIADGKYEIIAGERRWRAAQIAGLEMVPVVIRAAEDQEALEIALIENVQREDISPLEEAQMYHLLISEFDMTQEDVSKKVGKSRPAIANCLRLLRLPLEVRESLDGGNITEGHARALLQLDTDTEILLVHKKILEKNLTVRDVENISRQVNKRGRPKRPPESGTDLERMLSEHLGAPSRIIKKGSGGKIEVDYFDESDLQRIFDLLGIRE